MKKKIIFIFITFNACLLFGQTQDAWVYFNSKPSEATYLENPLTMLSQRAIDRRSRYNIALDFKDIPVETTYILDIESTNGITVLAKSKWLNALHVQGTQEAIENLLNFSFVETIEFADASLNIVAKTIDKIVASKSKNKLNFTTSFNYGQAANQITMLGGELLHENNYTGEGMIIALLDAGFPNVDNFDAFERVRANKQILGGYDYVNRSDDYYTGSYHGMAVLSAIAGYVENEFVGTAPDAEFYLFITEDVSREVPLEESLWVEAAEKADSLGVDVINTSLGYSNSFDEDRYNYTYNDMDGATAFITRGAEIAFSRGMLIVNANGNEGNNTWKYMNAPADGASVLSVGAVDATGTIASFSSYGPTADGRVKPDVCAQGAGVYIINASGSIATSNGTSFSSPVLTGLITCLWQAFQQKTNAEITQLVKESAHLYATPTAQEGYGIPNFETIYNTLSIEEEVEVDEFTELYFYPNPINDRIFIAFPNAISVVEVSIFDVVGHQIYNSQLFESKPSIDFSYVSSGLYFIQIKSENSLKTFKLLKN